MFLAPNNIKLDLAIPDSFLYGVVSEIDRTFKVFQLARALSIFRIDNLLIYQDKIIKPKKNEIDFLITLLEYLDTPQYLRKKIYPKLDSLRYVGKLHPIRSPHHKDRIGIKNIKSGEVRVGVLEKKDNQLFVDVGLDSLIKYQGKDKQTGKKINVKLLKKNNYLFAFDIDRENIDEIYWGYKVLHFDSITEVLKRYKKTNIILTSRYAEYFKTDASFLSNLKNNITYAGNTSVLIVFGSPKHGLKELFYQERINITNYLSFNFFPLQGTQTIRLEESIFGVLSILNSVMCF
ncbi:MAG: putative RNA uridine N3 methyltransferase [Candidatus Nitrosocosmicus sp.]